MLAVLGSTGNGYIIPESPSQRLLKTLTRRAPENWLFPRSPRRFAGQRWLNILLRSLHLVGIAGIAGGFLFALDESLWTGYWRLALATGVALSLLYLWSTALWLFQLKGIAILLKLALLAIGFRFPDWRPPIFFTIVMLSSIMAHAPGAIRGRLVLMRHRQPDLRC